jgi:hypothetical protein
MFEKIKNFFSAEEKDQEVEYVFLKEEASSERPSLESRVKKLEEENCEKVIAYQRLEVLCSKAFSASLTFERRLSKLEDEISKKENAR